MKCRNCGHQNRADKKFCVKCGAVLERKCPRCGSETEEKAAFCGECGFPLSGPSAAGPPAGSSGERKQVTVMFSDLSSYTAISEKLDPEEVREIMNLLFGEVAQIVARYEGIIEKFIGDAVMAVFGVPRAHEDDAVRAVRAALEVHAAACRLSPKIEARSGRRLRMHTGINTGLVVTGKSWDSEGTHGVTGDTVNLAARLADLAGPDEIVIGPATAREVGRFCDLAELAPLSVKGKSEQVSGFKVSGMKDRPEAVRKPHRRTPFLGREKELGVLREAAERLRQGEGIVVSVVGELGTGKSRLIKEFRQSPAAREMIWLEGYAHAFSQNISYAPLIDLLSRAWRIKEGDGAETVSARISNQINQILPPQKAVADYLASLFGVMEPGREPANPEAWKNKLYDSIRDLLNSVARRQPTVILLEDMHWSDPATLDLLRFLLSPYEFTSPALFLLTYRPGLKLFTLPMETGRPGYHRLITLRELSSVESQALILSLLGDEIPPDLPRFVHGKAGGNPFYLEELVNSLIESGTLARQKGKWKTAGDLETLDLPSTLQGVIASRLDRLDPRHKRVVQEAAVIGRSFSFSLLRKVSSAGEKLSSIINRLCQIELIQPRGPAEDREYLFKHALTQEAAYQSLLLRERQQLHEKIGRAIEELHPEEPEKFCELLAYHYARARNEEKEIAYSIMAGEKNQKANAVFAAAQYFSRASELLKLREAEPEKLQIRMSVLEKLWLNTLAADFKKCHETVQELLAAYERAGLSEAGVLAKARLMWSLSSMGLVNESQELFREIEPSLQPGTPAYAGARLCLAETWRLKGDYRCLAQFFAIRPELEKVNPAILAGDLVLTLGALAFSGRIDSAWREFESAMAYCDQHELFAVKIGCLIHALATCYFDGQYRRVSDFLDRMDRLYHRLGGSAEETIFPIYGGHMLCLMVFGDMGDLPAMGKNIFRLVESLELAGFDPEQARLLVGFCRGLLFMEQGEIASASHTLQETVDGLHRTMNCCFYLPHALNTLGRVSLRLGELERAKTLHEEALAWSEPRQDRPSAVYARRMLGLVYAAAGAFDAADTELRRALQEAESLGLRPHVAWTLEALAAAAARRAEFRPDEAEQHRRLARQYHEQSLALWEQMANPYQHRKAKERWKEFLNKL